MMRLRSAEGRLLHRKIGTLSAERWLLGRSEAIRRAQRRLMHGSETTNSARERVDNGSDFTGARIVVKLCRYNLFTIWFVIKLSHTSFMSFRALVKSEWQFMAKILGCVAENV